MKLEPLESARAVIIMFYDGDTENTSMNVKSSCTLMYSRVRTSEVMAAGLEL